MRWAWKIGRLAGITVYMHATFLLLILFILFSDLYEGHSLAAAASGVFFILVIFACVVLHELGHALTARRYGIKTRDIILLPIGGVARLERMPEDPRQELVVALAGPAVNVVIAGGLFAILTALGIHAGFENVRLMGGDFVEKLMAVNLWLAGFNLLPAFPMDGGRVLRALLATRMEYTRATQWAAHVGQAMALVFGFIGLFSDPFLLFIALFVWMGADAEASTALIKTSLGGIPVQRVMLKDFQTLKPEDTLAQAVDHILAGWQQDFPVVFGDHVLGILTREDMMRTLAQRGSSVLVRDVMRRDFNIADSHDMLEHALGLLHKSRSRSVPVEHDGHLVGMLDLNKVGEFMMVQSALRRAHSSSPADGR
ncbi:MAG TPA: site-2 protease family protein [Terriglobia bacterium]|nr:site-2 protease family protein [Terriglobia bacterium]